jgi:hypothetical protein
VTLLDDIVAGSSGTAPVSTLLRQLKVVAARTGTGGLAEWVERELNGYANSEELPAYRGPFDTIVLGQFMGPFGIELQNVPIPPSTLPEKLRDTALFKLFVLESVGRVETWAAQPDVTFHWSPDSVRFYNAGLGRGTIKPVVRTDMALATAVRPIDTSIFISVLDAVRNRILDLSLELERAAPGAGEPDASAEVKEQAAQVVNHYNFYGSSNVAIASENVTQTVQPPGPGDTEGLMRYLGAAGVDPAQLVGLQRAVDEDRMDDEQDETPGRWSRARAWFAGASTDVATGAFGGAISTAATAFLASR